MRLLRAGWVMATTACLLFVLGFFQPAHSSTTSASCVPTGAPSTSDVVLNEILPLPPSD